MIMPNLVLSDTEQTDVDRVYIRVNDIFDVRIVRTDEGIAIDVFPWGSSNEPIATTYAFDNEALAEMEEL